MLQVLEPQGFQRSDDDDKKHSDEVLPTQRPRRPFASSSLRASSCSRLFTAPEVSAVNVALSPQRSATRSHSSEVVDAKSPFESIGRRCASCERPQVTGRPRVEVRQSRVEQRFQPFVQRRNVNDAEVLHEVMVALTAKVKSVPKSLIMSELLARDPVRYRDKNFRELIVFRALSHFLSFVRVGTQFECTLRPGVKVQPVAERPALLAVTPQDLKDVEDVVEALFRQHGKASEAMVICELQKSKAKRFRNAQFRMAAIQAATSTFLRVQRGEATEYFLDRPPPVVTGNVIDKDDVEAILGIVSDLRTRKGKALKCDVVTEMTKKYPNRFENKAFRTAVLLKALTLHLDSKYTGAKTELFLRLSSTGTKVKGEVKGNTILATSTPNTCGSSTNEVEVSTCNSAMNCEPQDIPAEGATPARPCDASMAEVNVAMTTGLSNPASHAKQQSSLDAAPSPHHHHFEVSNDDVEAVLTTVSELRMRRGSVPQWKVLSELEQVFPQRFGPQQRAFAEAVLQKAIALHLVHDRGGLHLRVESTGEGEEKYDRLSDHEEPEDKFAKRKAKAASRKARRSTFHPAASTGVTLQIVE